MCSSTRIAIKLYKSILKLHRGLPSTLKLLGDEYVKEEFRRHKNLHPDDPIVRKFLKEWLHYAANLSNQLDVRGLNSDERIGSQMSVDQVDSLRDDQLIQLHQLLEESSKTYSINKNGTSQKNKDNER